MEVVYLLVVLAIAVSGLIAWAFVWSVKTGQFDDLEGPAHRILYDDDSREMTTHSAPTPRNKR